MYAWSIFLEKIFLLNSKIALISLVLIYLESHYILIHPFQLILNTFNSVVWIESHFGFFQPKAK